MPVILAYGDSLTWGAPPVGEGRHARADRWPTVLETALREGGIDAEVIAEGLNGRTTVHDDWSGVADRNGGRFLPVALASHAPLDAVVLMLGTNDLINCDRNARRCGQGMERLVRIVRGWEGSPTPVVVAPPRVRRTPDDRVSTFMEAEAAKLPEVYARIAQDAGALFFDANAVAQVSPSDGIHLDPGPTRAIGEGLAELLSRSLRTPA